MTFTNLFDAALVGEAPDDHNNVGKSESVQNRCLGQTVKLALPPELMGFLSCPLPCKDTKYISKQTEWESARVMRGADVGAQTRQAFANLSCAMNGNAASVRR